MPLLPEARTSSHRCRIIIAHAFNKLGNVADDGTLGILFTRNWHGHRYWYWHWHLWQQDYQLVDTGKLCQLGHLTF